MPQEPDTRSAAVWLRNLGAASWDQKDIADRGQSAAFGGLAPGTSLEVAVALTDTAGLIKGSRIDTVTVGDGTACHAFAGYASTDLRLFCTGSDLRGWVATNGLDPSSVSCGRESLATLGETLPNCVYESGSQRLVLLRGLDSDFRPGPELSREALRQAYLHVLFANSSPQATIWRVDPAIGTPLPTPRVGTVTGYQSATTWYTNVNAVGWITLFEPASPNGAIAIYHEGHGGEATEAGSETISWLLARGWSVVALNLPRVSHMQLRDMHADEGNPMWRMLYGIGQVTEWIHRVWSPDRDPVVVAIGRSGGGWASMLYAALDERIDATAVVSGFVPLSERLDEAGRNPGDWEQLDPVTFGSLDYTGIVRLADTRDLLLTFSEFDDCCFRLSESDPFVQWLGNESTAAPGKLTTVVSSSRAHGLTPEGYVALGELLDRALARGH